MLDKFAGLEVSPRLLILTVVVSTVLGLSCLALGTPMVIASSAIVLPWVPVLLLKLRADWETYGWLAFFELVVILQIAHFAEHVSQMIEIHFLQWAPILAKGIVSQLDTESVHFWWNTTILLCGSLLLWKYRGNRWLLGSWIFSIWHQIEHTYIFFVWYLPKGISNHPGILGAGGVVDEIGVTVPYLTTMGRPDLHFWYNFFEIGLFVVAFIWQAARIIHPSSAARAGSGFRRRNAFALIAAGQIAVLTLIGLWHYSPATLTVPGNYSSIQAAIDVAPDWAIIRVAPGAYQEALQIKKPITLLGSGYAATVIRHNDDNTPTLTVSKTHDVVLKNLSVEGGLYGVLVERSRSVLISQVAVNSAWFAGIRVSQSAANIEYSEIAGSRSPYGMGIELANTAFSGDSMIRNDSVHDNPHAGIDMHNSNAMIERNTVLGNGLRGIAVNEMSMAMVNSNTVSKNGDAGILVQDHSIAELQNNEVQDTWPGPSGAADGIRAIFYGEIMLRSNAIQAAPGHDIVVQSEAIIEPWH